MKSTLDMSYAFNYDDISLVPRVTSTLMHRTEAKPSVTIGKETLQIPILSSPMPDVTGADMCMALAKVGAMGVMHRFQSIADEVAEWQQVSQEPRLNKSAAAIGITGDWQERFTAMRNAGCDIFCLDTANGAHSQVEKAIAWLKSQDKNVFLMTGNVASAEAFRWLEDAGADAIRVSIASGSVCETRNETGVYAPTPYAIYEVAQVRKKALIIGDGGIRMPADFCKLLALGADVVMLGGSLAGTKESPGEVIKDSRTGGLVKIMRGAASFSVQRSMGNVKPEYVEGTETFVPYKDDVTDVVNRFLNGLRSSMSYMNARTLGEYRENVSILRLR